MIDVVIPCRNAPNSLSMCLNHLAMSESADLIRSVVILDNRSGDAGMEAIFRAAIARGYHVIRHERNVGVWCSINRGLSVATSQYVLVLTSDVMLGRTTLGWLHYYAKAGLAYGGPEVLIGISNVERLETLRKHSFDHSRYNGACWMMDWGRLREEVGWYDPRFYVAFGDVDYVERVRAEARRSRDPQLTPTVIAGLFICHLDKQSRRHDMTVEQDTDMELEDGRRFREKWANVPEVLAQHPELSKEAYLRFKAQDLGGWETAKV